MKKLNEDVKVNELKEIITEFEGNPGYTIVKEYGECGVGEGIDYGYDKIETVLVEFPENDYRKFDGENPVAIYEVLETSECDYTQNIFKTLIKRIK